MGGKPNRFLRLHEVLVRTGLSRATLYRRMASGNFPRRIMISARCAAWREAAIEEWERNPIFYSADD